MRFNIYLFIYLLRKYKYDENDMRRAHDAYNSLTVMISVLTYKQNEKRRILPAVCVFGCRHMHVLTISLMAQKHIFSNVQRQHISNKNMEHSKHEQNKTIVQNSS